MLNPINHARTRCGVQRYKVEPYVVAADVYSVPPHTGAAAGPGTRARPDGCTAPASRAFWAFAARVRFSSLTPLFPPPGLVSKPR